MTAGRHTQAGVTLIEMLAALAVSALIGVAGFSLLESVLQTEAGVADRLDGLLRQDRAFQLLDLDLQQALTFELVNDDGVALAYPRHTILWQETETGLQRRITFADRADVTQTPLAGAAQLAIERGNAPVLRLSLPEAVHWRVFLLPPERTP